MPHTMTANLCLVIDKTMIWSPYELSPAELRQVRASLHMKDKQALPEGVRVFPCESNQGAKDLAEIWSKP